MTIVGDLALFLVGFLFLTKGAAVLIDGAVSLAKIWRVSPWVIGVVIVGIGTSVPEFSINAASILSGTPLGFATVLGGNAFNMLIILGVVALISPITLNSSWVWKDLTVNVAAVSLAALLFVLPKSSLFYGISRGEGLLLSVVFFVWLWYMVSRPREDGEEKSRYKSFTFSASLLFIVSGFIGVFLGGEWVVEGGVNIARFLGMSEALIGLSVVGIGTSLPELAVSIAAAFKGRTSLAVGNIIGSNIFDFFGIFGILAMFRGIPYTYELALPVLMLLFTTLILFAMVACTKTYTLSRWKGVVLIIVYIAFGVYIVG